VSGAFNYTVTITDAAGHTGTLNCSGDGGTSGERDLRVDHGGPKASRSRR